MTQTDYFSKYVEAIPLPDKSALSVAKGALQDILPTWSSSTNHLSPGTRIC